MLLEALTEMSSKPPTLKVTWAFADERIVMLMRTISEGREVMRVSRVKFDMVVPPLSVKTETTNISPHPLSPLAV